MRIRKKILLVVAIAAAQAACLAWGVVVFEAWLTNNIRGAVHRQVLADNVETARQMSRLIHEMQVDDPRSDLESWERLQQVVRDIRLPNEGFVCLVDASTGRLMCHPDLKSRPEFGSNGASAKRARTPQQAMMKKHAAPSDGAALQPQAFRGWDPDKVSVSGRVVDSADGLQMVAAARLPEINAQVLVHQLGRGIDAAIARMTEPVRPIGLAVSLGLVAVTTIAVTSLVRRYESELAKINEHLEELVEQRTRALMKTRNGLIFGLAKLAESRDTDTGEHLDRIRQHVTILAEQLRDDGLCVDQEYIENLALASSLHDIGKVGVPDAVLLKPGRLDPEERRIIETHAQIGGDCLQALSVRLGEDDFLQLAKEIAYAHHERWDGEGYPFRVAGEMIPLSARVVAVADVYDALRSKRPYKDAMPHDKAKEVLLTGAGSHFDPVIVEAFLAAEGLFREVSDRACAAASEEAPEELAAL